MPSLSLTKEADSEQSEYEVAQKSGSFNLSTNHKINKSIHIIFTANKKDKKLSNRNVYEGSRTKENTKFGPESGKVTRSL